MPVLDLSTALAAPSRNRIAKVGVELEGGWAISPNLRAGGAQSRHDASVIIPVDGLAYIGEIVSPPLLPIQLLGFLRVYYPSHVNTTCGLHLHMSFRSIGHYHRLMTEDYQDTLLHHLGNWAGSQGFPKTHHIWKRLAGEEKYCHKAFWPDLQVRATGHGDQRSPDRFFRPGSRYTVVNYCFNIDQRQTVEVRVLPMMLTVGQAASALGVIMEVTNAFLYETRSRVRASRMVIDVADLDLDSERVDEEYLYA